MKVTTLGIDLAKSIFQLHGVNEHEGQEVRRAINRLMRSLTGGATV